MRLALDQHGSPDGPIFVASPPVTARESQTRKSVVSFLPHGRAFLDGPAVADWIERAPEVVLLRSILLFLDEPFGKGHFGLEGIRASEDNQLEHVSKIHLHATVTSYLWIPHQGLMIYLRKTKSPHRRQGDHLCSIAVGKRLVRSVSGVSLAHGDAPRELAALVGMSDLDQACENVGLPSLIKRVVELFDVSLEKPDFSLEKSRVGL